jgi:chromosome segregation ATPase
LRHLGGQIIVLAFVLLDIDGLGFALVSSIWLTPWVAINVTALVFGSLSWSEDKRIRRESATATWRQGEKVRAAEWWSLGELQRKAQRQHQQAERRQRQEEDEREAQKRLQAALRQAQEELREAEQRRYQEEKERETQKQQQSERAERLRQTQQQEREAQQRRRQAEEEREAQRKRGREHKRVAAQFKSDWWTVLGVAPSASKDEIVRKYRHKIKQCYADRVIGLAPELLHLAEEQTKALNGAYANAMRARRHAPRNAAAA